MSKDPSGKQKRRVQPERIEPAAAATPITAAGRKSVQIGLPLQQQADEARRLLGPGRKVHVEFPENGIINYKKVLKVNSNPVPEVDPAVANTAHLNMLMAGSTKDRDLLAGVIARLERQFQGPQATSSSEDGDSMDADDGSAAEGSAYDDAASGGLSGGEEDPEGEDEGEGQEQVDEEEGDGKAAMVDGPPADPAEAAAGAGGDDQQPPARRRKRSGQPAYDYTDDFIDDTELEQLHAGHHERPKYTGFYICQGLLPTMEDDGEDTEGQLEEHKKRRRKGRKEGEQGREEPAAGPAQQGKRKRKSTPEAEDGDADEQGKLVKKTRKPAAAASADVPPATSPQPRPPEIAASPQPRPPEAAAPQPANGSQVSATKPVLQSPAKQVIRRRGKVQLVPYPGAAAVPGAAVSQGPHTAAADVAVVPSASAAQQGPVVQSATAAPAAPSAGLQRGTVGQAAGGAVPAAAVAAARQPMSVQQVSSPPLQSQASPQGAAAAAGPVGWRQGSVGPAAGEHKPERAKPPARAKSSGPYFPPQDVLQAIQELRALSLTHTEKLRKTAAYKAETEAKAVAEGKALSGSEATDKAKKEHKRLPKEIIAVLDTKLAPLYARELEANAAAAKYLKQELMSFMEPFANWTSLYNRFRNMKQKEEEHGPVGGMRGCSPPLLDALQSTQGASVGPSAAPSVPSNAILDAPLRQKPFSVKAAASQHHQRNGVPNSAPGATVPVVSSGNSMHSGTVAASMSQAEAAQLVKVNAVPPSTSATPQLHRSGSGSTTESEPALHTEQPGAHVPKPDTAHLTSEKL